MSSARRRVGIVTAGSSPRARHGRVSPAPSHGAARSRSRTSLFVPNPGHGAPPAGRVSRPGEGARSADPPGARAQPPEPVRSGRARSGAARPDRHRRAGHRCRGRYGRRGRRAVRGRRRRRRRDHRDGAVRAAAVVATLGRTAYRWSRPAPTSPIRSSALRWSDVAIERFGRLDAVVGCAGVQPVAPLAGLDHAGWREVTDADATGSFALCRPPRRGCPTAARSPSSRRSRAAGRPAATPTTRPRRPP